MQLVPWVVVVLINWFFVLLTPYAAVSAAAWTFGMVLDQSINLHGASGTRRSGDALTAVVDMLVTGCIIIAALGALSAPRALYGLWVVVQIFSALYYARVPSMDAALNPLDVLAWIMFAAYVVLSFQTYFAVFSAIAFAPPQLRLSFNTVTLTAMSFCAVLGAGVSMRGTFDYIAFGVLLVLSFTSVIIKSSVNSANEWVVGDKTS
tara:strand:- start:139 stop:756 length:618 start_codon:yes stop_codon:yes gene_type:complete